MLLTSFLGNSKADRVEGPGVLGQGQDSRETQGASRGTSKGGACFQGGAYQPWFGGRIRNLVNV